MSIEHDPEEIETKYLHDIAPVTKTRVLEIGCGEGRLTWRYAASAGSTIGTDLNPTRLSTAQREYPPTLRSSLLFSQAKAETLPFPTKTFDLVILAWSL